MDRANHALATHLADLGHPVHLVAYRVDDDLLKRDNVTFHRVRKIAGSYLLSAPLLDRAGRRWARRIRAMGGRVIANGGNSNCSDINWVHYLHAAYGPVVQTSFLRRVKNAVHTWHSRATEAAALKGSSLIIANSNRTKDDIVRHYAIDASRIAVVHLAADVERFTLADVPRRIEMRHTLGWPVDRKIVLFVGAMSDQRKGFDTLFDAWSALCADPKWDANLVVIGAGSDLERWQARAAAMCLQDRITFLGFRRDLHDILGTADLLVAPTRYEAYGLGVHEALCCGVPVIVSADAGVAEIIPPALRDLMLLASPDDSKMLKAMLLRWQASGDGYRAAMAQLCQDLRQRSWQVCCTDIVRAIEGMTSPSSVAHTSSGVPKFQDSSGVGLQRSA